MGTPQNNLPFGLAIAIDILTFASVGLMEELTRAYQTRNLAEGLSGPQNHHWVRALLLGAVGASLYSALMHFNQQGMLFWIYVFLNSLIYCLIYFLTKRIAIAIGAHLAWDFFISTIISLGGTSSALNAAVIYAAPLTSAGETSSNMTFTTFIGLGLKVLGLVLVMFYIKLSTGKKPQLKKDISIYTPAIE
jgi:membrane protease YdiL (CAAX protease family)